MLDVVITGITYPEQMTQFEIYPNPAFRTVTIRANELNEGERITILTPDGRVVASRKIERENGKFTIDVFDLPKGIYIMIMESSGRVLRKRFVKEGSFEH